MCVSFLMWVSVMFLHKIYAAEYEVVRQPNTLMTVSVGDHVTLQCLILEDNNDPIVWYKQTAGREPHIIAMIQKSVEKPVFYNLFQSSRFTINRTAGNCHLTILNTISSDEAMYYCGWKQYEIFFAGGTFLALKGSQNNQHQFSVSVLQQPVSVSVHTGDSVTLLCSVLSERTTAEIQMFWFRSDSGKSVPQIIYTHNNSGQCEIVAASHNCTNSLSKDIIGQTDTGVYYCAVLTCGKVLFGSGTQINLVQPLKSVVIILGVLLGVCVLVITAQAVSSLKKDKVLRDIDKDPSEQDCDAVHLHYAAPHFKAGKTRRATRQEVPQDSVYSQLNTHSLTEYRIVE